MLEFTRDVFVALGATSDNASIVAGHLVESSRMGLNSHGVMRIPQYVRDIDKSAPAPGASPIVAPDKGGRIAIDARHAFGQVVGVAMASAAAGAAMKHG